MYKYQTWDLNYMFNQRLVKLVMIMKLLLMFGMYFIGTYLSFSVYFDNISITVCNIAYIQYTQFLATNERLGQFILSFIFKKREIIYCQLGSNKEWK